MFHRLVGITLAVGLLAWAGVPSRAASGEPAYDLVVYGGTSAGVAAAVQAARMDRSVVLVSPAEHLGGLSSSGLGRTDSGDKAVIGGLSREFYARIHDHYEREEAWTRGEREDYKWYRPKAETMWRFEPHVAERVFEEMIAEAEVPVVRGARLDRESGVKMQGGRIASITTLNGKTYRGRMFIDATYEGDLMAAAGVSYTVGRESNAKYGETMNGVQVAMTNERTQDRYRPVDPYVEPGNPESGLLFGVQEEGPGEDGTADDRVQAYCFRLCLTDDPSNRTDWPRPEGYDESTYELLLRWVNQDDVWVPWINSKMPNRKTDTNNHGFAIMSSDFIGANYAYPEAGYEEREKIVAEHRRYHKGLMWTLANHPRVPEWIREKVSGWGPAADEFQGTEDHWPYKLYIREARRMVGAYVMTEHDARRTRETPRPIGLGSYSLDSHHVQRYATDEGTARNEGNLFGRTGGPYQIAYGAITPKKNECENLLVPVCLSASHIAYGSIRMEPVFMILGQSAAAAASCAIEERAAVQEINYDRLRERLEAGGQVITPPGGMPPPHPPEVSQAPLDPGKLTGIVIDDTQAELSGGWSANDATLPFVGAGYRHDDNAERTMTARFTATLPRAGAYEVRIGYPAHKNRATNTPVTIHHAGGRETLRINQRQRSIRGKKLRAVGTYRFSPDEPASVVIRNEGANGYVVVDAVQFVPIDDHER